MSKRTAARVRHPGDSQVAYVVLRDHPPGLVLGLVKHTVDIHFLIENYNGPRLSLDFDAENRPVGIEIIYPSDDVEDEEIE